MKRIFTKLRYKRKGKLEVINLLDGSVKYEQGIDPISNDSESKGSIGANMSVRKGHRYENYEER